MVRGQRPLKHTLLRTNGDWLRRLEVSRLKRRPLEVSRLKRRPRGLAARSLLILLCQKMHDSLERIGAFGRMLPRKPRVSSVSSKLGTAIVGS